MRLPFKYVLTFILLLFLCGNREFISNSETTQQINSADSKSTDPDSCCLTFQNAEVIYLIHGEKVQSTVIPTPAPNDQGSKYQNQFALQNLSVKRKHDSFVSISQVLATKTINKSSLSDILRV